MLPGFPVTNGNLNNSDKNIAKVPTMVILNVRKDTRMSFLNIIAAGL